MTRYQDDFAAELSRRQMARDAAPPKITRDAFLFLSPKSRDDEFAQCGPCRMFVPGSGKEGGRCIIHGSRVVVDEGDSCGFMVPWPTPDGAPNPKVVADHAAELKKGIPGSVSPAESGLVGRRVQCHRCMFEKDGATRCGLYEKINAALPRMFDLDPAISPHSCCNAQEPKS